MKIKIKHIHYTIKGEHVDEHFHESRAEILKPFSKAINHHGELVEALTNLAKEFRLYQDYHTDANCGTCGGIEGHADSCEYGVAVKLLEKINVK